MCEPVSITMAAIAIAGTVAAHADAEAKAKKLSRAQNASFEEMTAAARANYNMQLGDVAARNEQERVSASQDAEDIVVDASQAKGVLNTAMAERGIGGNSVESLLNDFEANEGRSMQSLQTNLEWNREQSQRDSEGFRADGQNRVNQSRPGAVDRPSLLVAAVQVAGQGASAWNAYDQRAYTRRTGRYANRPGPRQ